VLSVAVSASAGNRYRHFFPVASCERSMNTMNISLPNMLKAFVDEQVSQHGYGTSSEYVRTGS